MNKVNQLFFRLVLLPLPLLGKAGIDTAQLKLILRYKLIMDDRHPNTFQQTSGRQRKEGVSNATIGTMLMALMMGMLSIIAFLVGSDDITHFSIFFMAFLFMLASILITDFTSVLIDVKDNMVLLPRPVNDRTLLVARLLHITIHLCRVILPLALPVLVFVWYRSGWWAGLSLVVLVMLATLFAIFLINAVYLLVLRVMLPERFKSFIAWFQIVFVIFVYGGYQFFLRVTDREDIRDFSITEYAYAKWFPPYWFAGAWNFLNGQEDGFGWLWLLLVVVSSAGSTWLVIRVLAPAFNSRLALIQGSGGQQVAVKKRKWGNGLAHALANLLTGTPAERAGFLFSWLWTGRNRGFRMRVYPTIGYVVVWVLLILFRDGGDTGNGKSLAGESYAFLVYLYISSFIIINAIQNVHLSDEYKASWIFYSHPVDRPGSIILGSFKSMLCKFFLPLAVGILVWGISWKGWGLLPNLVLGLANQVVICSLILLMGKKAFPASRPVELNERSGNFLRSLFTLLLTGGVGMLHFLVFRFTGAVILLAVLSLLAAWLLLRSIRAIDWPALARTADQ